MFVLKVETETSRNSSKLDAHVVAQKSKVNVVKEDNLFTKDLTILKTVLLRNVWSLLVL